MSLEFYGIDTTVDPSYLIVQKRLDEIRKSAKVITWSDYSKLLFLGDLHAGLGQSWKRDDFYKNYPLCLDTVRDYKGRGFHIFLPGDIIDLWENPGMTENIKATYRSLFDILDNEVWIDGNHDWELQNGESVLLRHSGTGQEILVCHGFQGDLFSDALWQVGRWITQNWGKTQEVLGISDPTAWKATKHAIQEEKLIQWADENIPIICGHTHRPLNQERYHNYGSWVGYGGQAIVLENGQLEERSFT